MGGRPGEVSARWVAARMGRHVKTVRRWCKEQAIVCRPEYGMRLPDGSRHVIRYWISTADAKKLMAQTQ